jgi:hypothetical protein
MSVRSGARLESIDTSFLTCVNPGSLLLMFRLRSSIVCPLSILMVEELSEDL